MISRQIFRQFLQMERPIANEIDKVLNTFDLTLSQWRIIAYLENLGTSTLVGISSYLSIEKPSVTRKISCLEEKHLVEQIIGKDKREKRIQLTSLGKEVFAAGRDTLDEIELRLLNGITNEEQRSVLQVLMKIRENINKVVG